MWLNANGAEVPYDEVARKVGAARLRAVDTETDGDIWYRGTVGVISIGVGPERDACYATRNVQQAVSLLEKVPAIEVYHNSNFDAHFLQRVGYSVKWATTEDTLIMSRVLDNLQPNHELKSICERVFKIPAEEQAALKTWREKHGVGYNFLAAPDSILLTYAAWDTGLTYRLYEYLLELIEPHRKIYELEMQVRRIMYEAEARGIQIDVPRLNQKYTTIRDDDNKLLQEIYAARKKEFNPNSDIQVGEWLYGPEPDGLGLTPVAFTEKTKRPQVDDYALVQAHHPYAEMLRNHNDRTTVLGYLDSYLELIDDDDKLHPGFNTLQARTGRMSSSEPNLQQVKKHEDIYNVRDIFTGGKGYICEFDFAKQELRLAAERARDARLLQAIAEGRDVYREMAAAGFGIGESQVSEELRYACKTASLAILYGAGAAKIAWTLTVKTGKSYTYEDAVTFRKNFRTAYPDLAATMRQLSTEVKQCGQITNPYGRRIYVDPGFSYKAFNAAIQSTAADETKLALTYIEKLCISRDAFIIGPVHDSVILWLPEKPDAGFIGRMMACMDAPRQSINMELTATAEVVCGKTWGTTVGI